MPRTPLWRPRIDSSPPEDPDDLDDNIDFGEEIPVKSRVVHVRVDPDLLLKIRRAALKVDRKPCDWVRRAILAYLASPEKGHK